MREGQTSVKEGLSLTSETGTTFANILGDINEVSNEIQEVWAVTEEVNASTCSALASMQNIANISTQSSINTQEVANSIEEQVSLIVSLSHTSDNLTTRAQKLTDAVNHFTIQ